MDTAYLSNEGCYTIFRYGDYRIKFLAPYSLERYENIKEWDDGYIVVMTKYRHNDKAIEEYIDLYPILENLYIDLKDFLKPIKKVEVRYD